MNLLADKLCLSLLFHLNAKKIVKIEYLDSASAVCRTVFSTLKWLGVRVEELDFCVGDIHMSRKGNIYVEGVKLAYFLSKDFSQIITREAQFKTVSNGLSSAAIQLHLAKCYQHELLEFGIKIAFLRETSTHNQRVLVEKPFFLSWDYIDNSSELSGIEFYSSLTTRLKGLSGLANKLIRIWFLHTYVKLRSYLQPLDFSPSQQGIAVLSPKEDAVCSNPATRNQQFWTLGCNKGLTYYVLGGSWTLSEFSSVSQVGETQVLPKCVAGMALRKFRLDSRLNGVRRQLSRPITKSLLSGDLVSFFVYTNLAILFKRSLEIGSIALYLNVRRYVFKETHNAQTDAIQLVSKSVGVTTYAIQYSNLLEKNCLMLTTADKFLIFSEMFKSVFSDEYFSQGSLLLLDILTDKYGHT